MPWGAGPEAPVPAPQTPHLLPSSLFPPENHCVSRSSFLATLAHERPGPCATSTFFSRLLALDHPWRVAPRRSRHPPTPHRPLARPSTQRLLHLSGMWPTRPRSAITPPPEPGGTSITAVARPGSMRTSPGSLAPRMASGGSASPGHCPARGSPSPSSGMPSTCCSKPTSWEGPDCSTSVGTRPGTSWNGRSSAGMRAKKRRVIAHLGVDEKAVAKRHRYVTLVCDLDRSTVEYIADDRKQTSLDAYYQSLSPKQLAGIEAVAMDMWDPFIASTVAHVPDGAVQDRLRPFSYHEAHARSGRRGAQAGTRPAEGRGRRDPQGDEVPVVVLGGEPAGALSGTVRRAARRCT